MPGRHLAAETWFHPVTLDKGPFCHLPCRVSHLGHRLHDGARPGCAGGLQVHAAARLGCPPLRGCEAHGLWAGSPCCTLPPSLLEASLELLAFLREQGASEGRSLRAGDGGVCAAGAGLLAWKGKAIFQASWARARGGKAVQGQRQKPPWWGWAPHSWHAAPILRPGCQLPPPGLAKKANSWLLRLGADQARCQDDGAP